MLWLQWLIWDHDLLTYSHILWVHNTHNIIIMQHKLPTMFYIRLPHIYIVQVTTSHCIIICASTNYLGMCVWLIHNPRENPQWLHWHICCVFLFFVCYVESGIVWSIVTRLFYVSYCFQSLLNTTPHTNQIILQLPEAKSWDKIWKSHCSGCTCRDIMRLNYYSFSEKLMSYAFRSATR